MPEPSRKVTVEVGGRRLAVSNLDKVLYPATETTKGEVLNYYARIGPILLPHLARRPVTRIRYPNGVEAASFFEKNLPTGAPAWLPRVTIGHKGDRISYPLATGLDALTYLANLASIELHVPQWQVAATGRPRNPDRLVIDLDPGPGAGLRECSIVALRVRDRLAQIGLTPVPVTSGSKGMQVYAALPGTHSSDDMSALAQQLAKELSAQRSRSCRVADDQVASPGQGLSGLEPERCREDDDQPVLAAGAAGTIRRHSPDLGGGAGGCGQRQA